MTWYLGGQTPIAAGWTGPRSVYVDFVSSYRRGWHWQLYAGRTLIGATTSPTSRRVTGQLIVDDAPAPLTLIRVDAAHRTTDYGAELPPLPWNRFVLVWTATGYPADASHFDLVGSPAAGEPIDETQVIACVPCRGSGTYRYALAPLPTGGQWGFGVVPRDDALPLGNAGTATEIEINAAIPPADLALDDAGNRFSLSVAAGTLTASFVYPESL